MGLIIRQSIKSSVGYYLGVILGAINTLFIATYYLSVDELAISRLLIENSLLFATFVHLGSPYIIDRFFSRFKNSEKGNDGMLGLMLLFPVLGFILFLIPLLFVNAGFKELFLEKSPSLIPFLWMSIPMSLFWSLTMVLEAYSRANKRIAVPTFLRETLYRILNIATIVIYGSGYISFYAFLILNVIILLVIFVLLLIYLNRLGVLHLNLNFIRFDKNILKEMAKFGGFVLIGSLGVNLVMFIDRNIIAQEIGTQAVAIFVIASYIATTIEIPAKALKSISSPILADNLFHSKMSKVDEIYKKSALNLMLIGGIMLVLVCVNIESLLSLLPKKDIYMQGKWIVIVIATAKWIDMSLGLNSEIIAFSKYYKVNTVLVILMAILVVSLNYLFIPTLGLMGSAVATATVTLISGAFRLLFVRYKFGMNPLSIRELYILFLFSGLFMIGIIIPDLGTTTAELIGTIALKSLLILSAFIMVLIRFNISQDITYLYQNIKRKALD